MSRAGELTKLAKRLAQEFKARSAKALPRNFHYLSDFDVTVNTSDQYVTKLELRFQVSAADAGIYRVEWCYSWNKDSTSVDFMARFKMDGQIFREHIQEAKDAAGNFQNTGSGQRKLLSSFTFLNLAAGSHVFIIEFRPQNTGRRSAMWDASASVQLVQEAQSAS